MKTSFPLISSTALWLVLLSLSTTHAADIRMGLYQHNNENVFVTTKDHDVFVICESCAATRRLILKPKTVSLAIRVATPAMSDVTANVEMVSSRNPSVDETVSTSVTSHPLVTTVCLLPVYFRLNHSDLSDIGKDQLDRLVSWIKDVYPKETLKVRVTGYTCDLGSRDYNSRLSLMRAESVASYLERQGLKPVEIRGEGSDKPLSDVRRLNRRVEINIAR